MVQSLEQEDLIANQEEQISDYKMSLQSSKKGVSASVTVTASVIN